MSTITHEHASAPSEQRTWADRILVREMWAALAIAAIWIAVIFTAVFGPDIISISAGVSSTRIPSATAVALFGSLATWSIAKYGFGGRRDDES